VRQAADAAVKALGWKLPYFCDADHITAATVDRFLAPCDFFTFDVADFIGQPAKAADIEGFVKRHPELRGALNWPGPMRHLRLRRQFCERRRKSFWPR
jgi:tagaturonate epimerase